MHPLFPLPHPANVPLLAGIHGLALLWDRRAAESAEGAAAEAYQRAAAEVQEVLRALTAAVADPARATVPGEQQELPLL